MIDEINVGYGIPSSATRELNPQASFFGQLGYFRFLQQSRRVRCRETGNGYALFPERLSKSSGTHQ